MSQTSIIPQPSQVARIRQRTYLVEDIRKPKRVADSTLVRLSCVDGDNQGQPLEVLWEKERDPTILTGEAWEDVAKKGFDDSLNTLKCNRVTSTAHRLAGRLIRHFQPLHERGVVVPAFCGRLE